MSDEDNQRKRGIYRDYAHLPGKARASTNPRGVVATPMDESNTPVFPAEDEPVSGRDLARFVRWVKKSREDSDAYINTELTELLDRPPKGVASMIERRIDDLERDMEPLNALRKWLWGSLVVVVITNAGFLYTRGSTEGRAIERMDRMEKFIEELRRDIRELERHSAITPLVPADAVSAVEQRNQS